MITSIAIIVYILGYFLYALKLIFINKQYDLIAISMVSGFWFICIILDYYDTRPTAQDRDL